MPAAHSLDLNCRYYRRYSISQPPGYAEEIIPLLPGQTAFLIVDVYGLGFDEDQIYGDVNPVYKDFVDLCRDIVINHIKPAKLAAKAAGLPVIYLSNYLAPSTTARNEWRNMSIRTVGVDVLEAWKEPNDVLAYSKIIAPENDDFVIKKQHYSGFFETHLESLLKELGAQNLIVVGFDSLICLHTTVIDALYRNYRVIVLRDCIGTGEFPETAEGGWANWLAVRFIECNVGYTGLSADFIKACQEYIKGLMPEDYLTIV